MQGLHIIADLYNCPPFTLLTSADALRDACLRASTAAGLSVLGEHFYQFESFDQAQAAGVTGAVVLAESHLAIHTWPERDQATLDIYVCNVSADNRDKAEALYTTLLDVLNPRDVLVQRVWRGKDLPNTVAESAPLAA